MFIFVYCEDDKQENIFASFNITYFVNINFLYIMIFVLSHYISDISFHYNLEFPPLTGQRHHPFKLLI